MEQNMIMNNYADRHNLTVELVIPEPMKSNSLTTLQWLHKRKKIELKLFYAQFIS